MEKRKRKQGINFSQRAIRALLNIAENEDPAEKFSPEQRISAAKAATDLLKIRKPPRKRDRTTKPELIERLGR